MSQTRDTAVKNADLAFSSSSGDLEGHILGTFKSDSAPEGTLKKSTCSTLVPTNPFQGCKAAGWTLLHQTPA